MAMIELIAGVDEVGRGPLAGPVVAAVVILDPARPIAGLADSKVLSPARREELSAQIKAQALAWALGRAEVEEIDRLNILHASLLAMERAVSALALAPTRILIDGNRRPRGLPQSEPVIGGDATVPAISAASIVAKVARDRTMWELAAAHPEYGWHTNVGYGTDAHCKALKAFGPTPHHRRSFAPVRECLPASL